MKSCFAALMGAFLFVTLASTAHAQTGFYVSGFAGAVILSDSDVTDPSDPGTLSFDTGAGFGGAFGFVPLDSVRVEGEIAYRTNGVDSHTDSSGTTPLDGDMSALSFMGNAFYDFDLGMPLVPYVGAGVGFAAVFLDASLEFGGSTVQIADDSDTVFAYQGIVGIAYEFSGGLVATADYRYFATMDAELTETAAFGGSSFEASYASHNLTLGIRYQF